MKKIITLHPADLDSASEKLAEAIAPFEPTIIVGILSGGGEVGRRVSAHFPAAEYHEVALQRPSTRSKHHIRRLLRLLPTWLADMLRRYESRRAAAASPRRRQVTLPESLVRELSSPEQKNVLIIDDAVDSGVTLLSVAEAVREEAPDADIRTGVLTVTTDNPAISPDYALWRDNRLLRFPWSLDYKPLK